MKIEIQPQTDEDLIVFKKNTLNSEIMKYEENPILSKLIESGHLTITLFVSQNKNAHLEIIQPFWEEIIPKIETIKIDKLQLQIGNCSFRWFSKIAHIHFSDLVFLSISGEGNINVERLFSLKAPKLISLILSNVNLTNVKALRKIDFTNLQLLDISKNYLNHLTQLTEMPANNLSEIALDSISGEPKLSDRNLTWLLKMQLLRKIKICSLNSRHGNRINLKFYNKVLSSKHYPASINILVQPRLPPQLRVRWHD